MSTPPEPPGPPTRTGLTDAQRWTLGGIGAVVVLVLVVFAVVAAGDDDDGQAAPSTTTTTTPDTTTTTAPTTSSPDETTTTTFAPDVDPFAVAFPSPEGSRRFDAPAAAARAYATDVLGFEELVLGAPIPGAEGTDVVVRPSDDGPETRIQVVQAGDAWFVTGSTTPDITVTAPAPGTSLATPFQTTGDALAFEGTVEVLVLTQDDPTPIGTAVVTGSGTPPPGPFTGDVSFTPRGGPTPGVLVYRARSPEDGRVLQATSVRVRLTALSASAG